MGRILGFLLILAAGAFVVWLIKHFTGVWQSRRGRS